MTNKMSHLNTLRFIVNHPLNRRKPVAALIRFLRWQLGSRLINGDIVFPWINGAKVIVRNGETGFTQNIYCGLHEFSEMAYLLHALRPEDLFVDVGANIGSYTILAGASVGAKVICFEPVPSTYERLITNIKLNLLEETVRPVNMGISNEIGTLLFTNDQDTMNHVISASESSDCVEVKVDKLDKLIEDDDPSILKIDVEGYETRVLEGAEIALTKESLHSIMIELNGSGGRYGFDETKIIQSLCEHGFLPYEYDPFNRSFHSLTTKNHSSSNTLFIRNLKDQENRIRSSPKYSIHGTEF
jgi:FkbM family methyltransferase